jgi:pimeloyl-ACP methyl ester carboxylesterase
MIKLHKDAGFDAQLKRSLGYVVAGGAEISECLSAGQEIKKGDYNGWHDAWFALANHLQKQADEVTDKSPISAGEMLLRASNYYRTAYFFLEEDPQDARIKKCLNRSKNSYKTASHLLRIPCQAVNIPYMDTQLPGYLYLTDKHNAPLLIDTGGGDSTLEELYFTSGCPALRRGYHCLTFEGPGQGSVLRLQNMPFRHDWEHVITSVVDFLEKFFPELSKNLILTGSSFGGYLAARAVTVERRIKACILNPGILNPARRLAESSKLFQLAMKMLMRVQKDVKFKIKSRYMRFGASSFSEFIEKLKLFSLEKSVDKIQCPMLVLDNEEEHLSAGEAVRLYHQLKCSKLYYKFKKDENTGGHCQPFAQNKTQEMIFDWIDALK